jgi:HNH/ENDO VII superfamily nuclease
MAATKDHIQELQKAATHGKGKGCVTKCVASDWKKDYGSYRYNGYQEHIKPAKSSYYVPDPLRIAQIGAPTRERLLGGAADARRTPSNPARNPLVWSFGFKTNFKNANRPYAHNYHHMVPWEALSSGLNQTERKALQQAEYNLNAGINLIVLPCFRRVAMILEMYTHPNDHPDYNLGVIRAINAVKFKITGDEERHLKVKELPKLKAALEAWEVAEWANIMVAGKLANAAHVKEYGPSPMALRRRPAEF